MSDSTGIVMESKRTRLSPPTSKFIEELYVRASKGEFPWLWRGAPQTPHTFHDVIWRDILVQYAIEDARSGAQIGLIGAYSANLYHRYAYITFTLLPDYERQVWPYESALLFGNLLFTRYDLENLYSETTGSLYEKFQSGAGRLFSNLAQFPGRLMIDGQREDLIVTGMSRQQWAAEGIPLLKRVTTVIPAS